MPIKFDQYVAAEAAFQARYGDWLEKYPNLALLVESKLREEFDRQNGRRLHERKKKPLSQYLPSYGNWRSAFYRTALNFRLALPLRWEEVPASIFFYWSQEVKGSISRAPSSSGFLVNRGDAKGLDIFRREKIRIQTVTAVSPALWTVYKNIYTLLEQGHALETSLSDPSKIDGLVVREVDRVARLITASGLKYLVTGSDQSPYFRILFRAASLAGAKTAVIGHGYFGSRHLGGVLPVYADRLFVWTRLQREQIHQVMRHEERYKVVWEGFPYPINGTKSAGKSVLLVMDDIPNADPETWWRAYDAALAGLVADGWQVIVRPRRASDVDIFRRRSPHQAIIVRKVALYEEFEQVSAVVGGASSVVIQAAYYGLESVRVLEWTDQRQDGEGIERIGAEDIAGYLRSNSLSSQSSELERISLTLEKIVGVLKKV